MMFPARSTAFADGISTPGPPMPFVQVPFCGQGGVVTTFAALGADSLRFRSTAVTVYEYVAAPVTDASLIEVAGASTCARNAPSRNTR